MQNKKLKLLYKQRENISVAINNLQDLYYKEKIVPKLKKLIGKCYVYPDNRYSYGKPFNTYNRVIACVDSNHDQISIIVEEVEIDDKGQSSIQIKESNWLSQGVCDPWKEIDLDEYNDIRSAVLIQLQHPELLIKHINQRGK